MKKLAQKIFPIIDGLIIAFAAMLMFVNYTGNMVFLLCIVFWLLTLTMVILNQKDFYSEDNVLSWRKAYLLFESIAVSTGFSSVLSLLLKNGVVTYVLLALFAVCVYSLVICTRLVYCLYKKIFIRTKNVLIVGAGQDGKLIAEEIQQNQKLGLNVVGFLDDNMNSIEDEDSTIPILGLTCDSEAVIKDNNVKLVIIAVKSRMDSNILTDLVKGIPLGVKVWRMYRFYEKITHKFLVSKMSVNWLFYDCVRKKALLYAIVKRFCDIIASLAILVVTSPLALIAVIGIKLSDFGPIFYTQMRAGKFGKPFKLIKFRTMYHDKLEDDFDDDLNEVRADDLRIIPFCRILRKFHIDEIPQMLNVLKGDMSIVGPRAVREEVYEENKLNVPFWECRNWVHPGWCGWQQVNVTEPTAEERIGYDLYFIKHMNLLWEISIFCRYMVKVLLGKARGK